MSSSILLRQSAWRSHFQEAGMHWLSPPHCHWCSMHATFGDVQFWTYTHTPQNGYIATPSQQPPAIPLIPDPHSTFSSQPSMQSASPSQSHSFSRHSWLLGQRSCVGQCGGLEQPHSSEWSRQSGWPSQRRPLDKHWPLAQR